MKKSVIMFSILLAPLFSFAGFRLLAADNIEVKAGVDMVSLMPQALNAKSMPDGFCVLKVGPAGFPRTIAKFASFNLVDVQTSPSWTLMTADELRDQIKQRFGIELDPSGKMNLDQLKEELKNKFGLVYNAEVFYTQTLNITSVSTGVNYKIVCKTFTEQTADSILTNLFNYGLLKPTQDL